MKTITTILTAVALMGITASSAQAARGDQNCSPSLGSTKTLVSNGASCSTARLVERKSRGRFSGFTVHGTRFLCNEMQHFAYGCSNKSMTQWVFIQRRIDPRW